MTEDWAQSLTVQVAETQLQLNAQGGSQCGRGRTKTYNGSIWEAADKAEKFELSNPPEPPLSSQVVPPLSGETNLSLPRSLSVTIPRNLGQLLHKRDDKFPSQTSSPKRRVWSQHSPDGEIQALLQKERVYIWKEWQDLANLNQESWEYVWE